MIASTIPISRTHFSVIPIKTLLPFNCLTQIWSNEYSLSNATEVVQPGIGSVSGFQSAGGVNRWVFVIIDVVVKEDVVLDVAEVELVVTEDVVDDVEITVVPVGIVEEVIVFWVTVFVPSLEHAPNKEVSVRPPATKERSLMNFLLVISLSDENANFLYSLFSMFDYYAPRTSVLRNIRRQQ